MDNTLELSDTVQGSMMLKQAGLSLFEQNMVSTYTKGQRTMTAIAEALLEQHYDVHHRGREMWDTLRQRDTMPAECDLWREPVRTCGRE